MRPDEHKKKKSAQYKQKHATNTPKGENKVKVEKTAGKPNKDVKSAQQVKSTPTTSSNISDSEEDEASVPGITYEKKTFQRRKIVSNWDRYEIPVVDETVEELKGSDFSQVMALTSSAVSQFRLKDEKNWESEISDSCMNEYLTLDLDDLSSCLDSIPLYRKLAIDKHLFTETQIKEMEKQANLNRERYISRPREKKSKSSKLQTVHDSSVKPETDCDDNIEKITDNFDLSLSLKDKRVNIICESNSSKPCECVEVKQSNPVASAKDQEDELEQLLKFDDPSTTEQTKVEEEDFSEKCEENTRNAKVLNQQVSGTVPGMEDLEDWLDSVLDS